MNKKLHILFLCSWYPSKISPTNGDFIQRHAEAVSLKHKVSVIHIISDKNLKKNIEITINSINGVQTHIAYTKFSKNPVKRFILFFIAFKKLILKIGSLDIVHLNEIFPLGIFSLYLKWFYKKKYIISEHWTVYHYPQSKKIGFFQKIISKIISKNASFVCPVSNNLANSMRAFGLKGNYSIVPNVVDTNMFVPIKKKSEEFTIIHISSLLDKHKNISDMLTVAKSLETEIGFFNWKFIGGTSDKYEKLLTKLDFKIAKIEFINHIPQKKLVNYLQVSNVFVLFSNYENLPCVILESFSCGVPVISTDVGGISEFFPNNFGKLISPKNKKKLLEELLYYFENRIPNKQEMHAYAIQNFSKNKIQESFSDLYYKTIK